MKKITHWLALLFLAFAIGGCAQEESQEIPEGGDDLTAGPVSLDEDAMTARIVGGSLEIYFPLTNTGDKSVSGEAEVICRHLSGEQTITGTTTVKSPSGEETLVLKVNPAPALESTGEQAEWVVEYMLELSTGKIRGKRSLFMLLDKADLIVLLPNKLMEGQQASIRAFLIDPRTNLPIVDTKIALEVTLADGTRKTYEATTDEVGVAIVEMPAEEAGELQLKAMVYGEESQGTVEADVSVVRESKLLLTTDKPMYQPGQLMHLRALALNRFDKSPMANDEILFEVFDANGNKVFKRASVTNEYGIAWGEFQLASQVILGPYNVKATVGEVVSEKTVTVDRYSLPKFKVDAQLDKSFYQPGQTVHGEVDVQYFFGKPVAGGEVKVSIFNYVADWQLAQEIVGETNDEGLYTFDYQLPDYLIGQPIEDGKALVLMEIAVTDAAEHEQKVAKQLLVTNKLLDVVVIPESGDVVPDVWNTFYLFVSDPSGQAVGGGLDLVVNGADWEDEDIVLPPTGPAKVALLPHEGQLSLEVTATSTTGDVATRSFDFSVGSAEANVLLRTDRALYKVGETMAIDVYIAGGYQNVFFDMVRKGQTVLTKTLKTEDGVATLEVDLDSEMSEDLVLSAYFLNDSGQFIRDTAVVYVQPANTLHVTVSPDQEEYQPGDTAVIEFEVTNENAEPTPAALGIQVVDEAVFALSEMKPGLMELYFQLEEEFQNPTYQIGPANGFTLGSLITSGAGAEPGTDEETAIQDTTKAAFAAMDNAGVAQGEYSTWKEALAQAKGALGPFYDIQKEKIKTKLELRLAAADKEFDQACDYLKDYLATPRYWDFWDQLYQFEVTGDSWDCQIVFTSNGPDERPDTADDWSGSLDVWSLSGDHWKGGREFAMAGGMDEDGAWDANGPPEAPTAEEGEQSVDDGGSDKSGIKVRSWFPETLLVEPSLITDESGKVSLEVTLADSITEWRMTTLANSMAGDLGSRSDGIIVFQDFFVDIDFPKYLTQNDEISFPIAIYNYLPQTQSVTVELVPEEWFDLLGADSHTVSLAAGEVSVVYFPVKVTKVGWHKLTVYGMGDALQDAIQRTVEVKPDGKEIVVTESARFDNDGENPSTDLVNVNINFPEESIEGSRTLLVKVLPGLSSHVVEGMESLLKLPGG